MDGGGLVARLVVVRVTINLLPCDTYLTLFIDRPMIIGGIINRNQEIDKWAKTGHHTICLGHGDLFDTIQIWILKVVCSGSSAIDYSWSLAEQRVERWPANGPMTCQQIIIYKCFTKLTRLMFLWRMIWGNFLKCGSEREVREVSIVLIDSEYFSNS